MEYAICKATLHQLINKNSMPNGGSNNWLQYSGIGIQMAATIIICWWLGEKSESYLNIATKPWGQLAGLFFGMFTGIYNLIKQVK